MKCIDKKVAHLLYSVVNILVISITGQEKSIDVVLPFGLPAAIYHVKDMFYISLIYGTSSATDG